MQKHAPTPLHVISLQSATNLYYTVKLEHSQGEMTPIHLIPWIISCLHSCWFGASVWAIGIEVEPGSVAALFSTPSFFIYFPGRQGMVQVSQKPAVTTKLLPAVGKRRDSGKAVCLTMTQQGNWHFWLNPSNTVGFFQLFIWEGKTFLACNPTSACQHSVITKMYSYSLWCEPKWKSECYFL